MFSPNHLELTELTCGHCNKKVFLTLQNGIPTFQCRQCKRHLWKGTQLETPEIAKTLQRVMR